MFVMVWFYYISNIWKNQVFLKNRSPDFLLSPFFAQCECAVTRGTAAAKGKRAAAQESPLSHCAWRNASSPKGGRLSCRPLWGMGTTPAGQDPFAEMLFKALFCPGSFLARRREDNILSFLFLSFFICVQLLCKCCASVVHLLCTRAAKNGAAPSISAPSRLCRFCAVLDAHCALCTAHCALKKSAPQGAFSFQVIHRCRSCSGNR